ncbi:MAG: GNAT family N-acetyltransferase, partial [Anaerolineae bacterium]|nr:GNAT family N-acetyltransferase [Anaerolineae bacterium]
MRDRDRQNREGLSSPEPSGLTWELKVATEADVEPTVARLSGHMNDQQRAAFRDKLQRYVRKPDRDVILALSGDQIVGFLAVIEEAEVPETLPTSIIQRLLPLASCTNLLVHPDHRRQGIGSSLFRRCEQWARERGRSGCWLITHRMASWYER